jgi:hypothetical protein
MRGRYLEYFISEQILFFLKQFAKKNKWLALLQPPKVASTLASGPASVRECRVTAQLTNNIAQASSGQWLFSESERRKGSKHLLGPTRRQSTEYHQPLQSPSNAR